MNNPEVLSLIDQISQALVFGDQDNLEDLQNLPELFGEVGAMIRELDGEEAAEACQKALSLSLQVLEGRVDWSQGLEVLVETVNALQACVSGECSCSEAGLPEALFSGLPEMEAETPDSTQPVTDDAKPEAAVPEAESPAVGNDNPGLVDDGILGEFLTRQLDILEDVEKHLLSLEEGQDTDETWLLRFYHTLKGESALLGMNQIADLCHAIEDMIQKHSIAACVEGLLEANDWFMAHFRHVSSGAPAPASVNEMLARVNGCAEAQTEAAPAAPAVDEPSPEPEPVAVETPSASAPPAAAAPPAPAESQAYAVVDYVGKNILEGDSDLLADFVEEANEHLDAAEVHLLTIESDPRETEALNAVFRGFHTIKGLAGFIELDHIKDLAHKAENLLDMARREELELVGGNMDAVFESVDMMKRLVSGVIQAMGGDGILGQENNLARLMGKLVALTSGEPAAPPAPSPAPVVEAAPEPVVEATAPEPETEPAAQAGPPKTSGFIPLSNMKKKAEPAEPAPAPEPAVQETAAEETPAFVEAPPAATQAPEPAPAEDQAPPRKTAAAPVKVKEAVRVDSERLDRLIETIGELVIAESMVTQSSEIKNAQMSVKLSKDIDHLDKICRELQEIGMSLRMVPVRPVFQKMARLVRDLSKKTGRKVDFVMHGEDTELDKNVVDKIGDPLVHMVRNSVDHGIEPDSENRVAAGKSERGRVELRAFHKGGNICIEIEDDGRGLDKNAILEKAVSRGLIREGEQLSDREIFNMIFEAGFSTAKKVTEVSGRGVGMDVVRRNIEELRGTVEIASEKGKGSTFSIKLPLTLAIIEGMVILVGGEHYIIPTLSVVRLIRPRPDDITYVFDKGEMLAFEGEHLPLFRLSSLFDVEEARAHPHEGTVVVVEDEGKKIGLMADDLLGQQSIVIKSLGETMQGTDGVAGGAIMSNGNVALILDIAGIVRVAHATDTTRQAAASLDADVMATVAEADLQVVSEEAETGDEVFAEEVPEEEQPPLSV